LNFAFEIYSFADSATIFTQETIIPFLGDKNGSKNSGLAIFPTLSVVYLNYRFFSLTFGSENCKTCSHVYQPLTTNRYPPIFNCFFKKD